VFVINLWQPPKSIVYDPNLVRLFFSVTQVCRGGGGCKGVCVLYVCVPVVSVCVCVFVVCVSVSVSVSVCVCVCVCQMHVDEFCLLE
jgi:hypothetical protein